MNAAPRALLALAVLALAMVPLPYAAADDCVEVSTATFSEGMRIIANAGRNIALGFRSGDPGDGVAFVVIITPSVCSGFGLGGSLEVAGIDPVHAAGQTQDWALDQVPLVLPLP